MYVYVYIMHMSANMFLTLPHKFVIILSQQSCQGPYALLIYVQYLFNSKRMESSL